jgi:hypothetical protein
MPIERLGSSRDSEWTSADAEGREILWATLLFRLSEGHSRAIDRAGSITSADRKVATCKLALIRALCDITTTSWAPARRGGKRAAPYPSAEGHGLPGEPSGGLSSQPGEM